MSLVFRFFCNFSKEKMLYPQQLTLVKKIGVAKVLTIFSRFVTFEKYNFENLENDKKSFSDGPIPFIQKFYLRATQQFLLGTGGAGKARFNVATPTNATVTCTAYVLPYNFQTKSI